MEGRGRKTESLQRRRRASKRLGALAKKGAGVRRVIAARLAWSCACLLAIFATPAVAVESLRVQVHGAIPHDVEAFTQGLLWWNGKLYESTGRRGASELRRLDPASGAIEQRVAIPVFFFGEGLARVGNRLHMLTWQAERSFVFDLASFRRLATNSYRGEGWGLCHDGARFVMSSGANTLTFRDTATFAPIGELAVTLAGAALAGLNELECVGDAIYANVFQRDFIVRIDAATGRVTQRIDASGLLEPTAAAQADVLNGIAYNPHSGRFYVTGKLWPWIFEVTFE